MNTKLIKNFKTSMCLSVCVFLLSGHAVNAQYTAMSQPAGNRSPSGPNIPLLQENNQNGQGQDQTLLLNENLLQESEAEKAMREQKIEEETNKKAYKRAQDALMPMSQEQIRKILSHLRVTQEAIQTPVAPPPMPDIHVEDINLDPAAEPPVIQLATSNVTTLTFLDMTGQPWPVVDMGFAGEFDVKPPEPGGHVIRITPLKEFGAGNLSVRLYGFKTPVAFQLRSGGSIVHYRYDARIPDMGPNAQVSIIENGLGITAGDKTMVALLEGSSVAEAKELFVKGVDGRTSAYEYDSRVILRTPLTLLSPAWTSSMSSADGMNVYSIPKTPVLLLSNNGEMVRAHLSRKGETYVE